MKTNIILIVAMALILIISVEGTLAEITTINENVVYPGEDIRITIKPTNSGFFNIIYVYEGLNLVDTINVNCNTICTKNKRITYTVPLNFLGQYYFATFDYNIDDYELDYFDVIESGTPKSGELNILEITNVVAGTNFLISPEQGKNADILISANLILNGCQNYIVNVYLCDSSISVCDKNTFTHQVPLIFSSRTGQTCLFEYTGEDYFPFFQNGDNWNLYIESGILNDQVGFVYTSLIAINYPTFINFGTLNALIWNVGVPPAGLELSNDGNLPLTMDWQSAGFSCISPPSCSDFWPTQEIGTGNPTFQIDDDNIFAQDPGSETGSLPAYIIPTPNNFFPATGLPVCTSDQCDSGNGEKITTYYNLKFASIERGVYQGDIDLTLF